tara:strand:- start:88 stop:513 length:426 start_codon:yes stop_codon:yes gene_type:complete
MKFHIILYADYWHKAPQVKVDINNDVIWKGIVNQNSPNNARVIEFEKEIPDDEEIKLNIILEDKTDDQTVIEDGKTIKDQLLHIKNIEIDDIDIEDLIWEATYTPKNKTPQKRTTCLGINGTWTLKFKSPFYLWLLERQTW